MYCIVFIHFYSASHSMRLSEALVSQPQQLTLCRSLHAEARQAIASEGLAWQLERDSNPRPTPYHAPQVIHLLFFFRQTRSLELWSTITICPFWLCSYKSKMRF